MSSPHRGNPNKRQRTEEAEENHPADVEPATRDEKHWYSDGSLVLRVEGTLFRVHKTLLATNSEIFRDMLTVPQPPVHDDVDGCPSVTLQGDSANGWRHVLNTLYDASFLSALHLRKLGDTLPIVSDVVRIATKYRFTGLRRECLAILGRHFPTSLDTVPRNRPSLEQATAVINLAREIGGLSLLPFAYLICINAVDRDDPSIIYRDLPISFEDKAAALQGLHTVLNAQAEEMFPYAYEDAETATLGCSERCSTKEAFECFVEDSGYLHFFHGEPFDEFCIAHEFLCLRCRIHVNEVFAGGKWRIWKRLPEFFCLAENWEELIRLQDLDS